MTDPTPTRWIVRDGIEAEDGGPCDTWWAYKQYLHDVSEFEPGFPVLDEDWRDDESVEAVPFDSAEAAQAWCDAQARKGGA